MKKNITCMFVLLALLWAAPQFAQRDYRVHFLRSTEIFPENFSNSLHQPVPPRDVVAGYYHRFIQFYELPTDRQRAEMEATGLQFDGYISFGAYLVAIPQGFDMNFLKKYEVRSIVPVQPVWKISNTLIEQPYGEWAMVGDRVQVVLQTYPEIDIAEAARLCHEYGIEVIMEGNQNEILQVLIYQKDIETVAALPFVQFMELMPPPAKPDDTGGRSIHRANILDTEFAGGRKYTGEGVGVLCRDDGQVGPHIDFQGRITNLASLRPGQTHGDGVSGIMAGAGNLNPSQKGMAAGADLWVIDYVNHFQDNTLELHKDKNVLVTNSSYSDGCNQGYTTAAQTVDRQIFENKTLMHVFSAGNSNGVDCSYGAGDQWGNITGGHKMGKNAIATANLFADGVLATSSSRGPAHDGRLKPDIAAHGQEQGSTAENNTYQSFGGTSGAAPGIAGCLAQLHQAYREVNNGEVAPSALLKVAILNTANDMGNPGPDFKFGWGHINAYRAARLIEEKRWVRASISTNGSFTFPLDIPTGVRQARVMLYWAERQASANASKALLHNLDLSATDAAGNKYAPFVLDATADPAKLDLPAARGADNLNNVEQIAIENPTAGQYIFTVLGKEIPFGPQEFYIVWDFQGDEVEITYPAGGEGFTPSETQRIHWDAYGNDQSFQISYAADGQNYQNVATVDGSRRMYNWLVPTGRITHQAKLKITRNGKEFPMQQAFSIVGQPTQLKVERVCPDSMTVSYTAVHDTLATDIYVLGKKYMEITSTAIGKNTQTFPYKHDGKEVWLATRTSHSNGLNSRRTIAIRYPGGLQNCPQPFDGTVGDILQPAISSIVSCNALQQPLEVRIVNDGLEPITGAKASYQVDNQSIITDNIADIPAGGSIKHLFSQQMVLSGIGMTVKIWVDVPGDFVKFNDTLTQFFPVVTQPATGYYSMNFQNLQSFPPLGWTVENADNGITWAQINTTGTNGNNTQATYLNCFSYTNRGALDHLYMIPVQLGIAKPGLAFSLAHARNTSGRLETLKVEVFEDCNLNSTPIKIWEKSGAQLSTTVASQTQFFPDAADDWRTEVVDLQPFAGKTVIIRFTGVNDQGNNIFLDNIRIVDYNLTSPKAIFSLPAASICRLDTLIFTQNSTGNFLTHSWIFGAQASPSTASGPGPHAVRYLTPGNKIIRLIVSNTLGTDTMSQSLTVLNLAFANFTQSINGNTVSFNNTSVSGDSYLWDFGDGNSSTEKDPVHTYASTGTFNVKLTTTNACRVSEKVSTVEISTIGTNEASVFKNLQVLPNPTLSGNFWVEIDLPSSQLLEIELFDARGSLLKQQSWQAGAGQSRLAFENLNLPKGIYQIKISGTAGSQTTRLVVQ